MSDTNCETLFNGAIVLASKPLHHGDRIVLAFRPGDAFSYVTWRVDANGEAFTGHYFENCPQGIIDAAIDFKERNS